MDAKIKEGDFDGGMRYSINPVGNAIWLHLHRSGVHTHFFLGSLPHLFNFYRDLGAVLDWIQPGLVNPLPDGDPNTVDAMKVIFEADRIRREEV